MSQISLPSTEATVHCEQLIDDAGRLVLVPSAIVAGLRAAGHREVTFHVVLEPAAPPRPWLTVTEAARLHQGDLDGLTVASAKVRITRACARGEVRSEGTGTRRRIDPESLDAWRLKAREADLDRMDD